MLHFHISNVQHVRNSKPVNTLKWASIVMYTTCDLDLSYKTNEKNSFIKISLVKKFFFWLVIANKLNVVRKYFKISTKTYS